VAQPDDTRHGAAAFEHHPELPQVAVPGAVVTVFVGEVAGERSPARADTPIVGAEVRAAGGRVVVPVAAGFEHALVMLEGGVTVGDTGDTAVGPGVLAYLGRGRGEVVLDAAGPARLVVLGGAPFEAQIVMSWNFVGRSRDEVDRAAADWNAHDARFGSVASSLARIPAPTGR
jgi:quercetin 2,3-dioxygenase